MVILLADISLFFYEYSTKLIINAAQQKVKLLIIIFSSALLRIYDVLLEINMQ